MTEEEEQAALLALMAEHAGPPDVRVEVADLIASWHGGPADQADRILAATIVELVRRRDRQQ